MTDNYNLSNLECFRINGTLPPERIEALLAIEQNYHALQEQWEALEDAITAQDVVSFVSNAEIINQLLED